MDDLNEIRAGADSTPVPPGVIPKPGQLWHRLLSVDPLAREEMLGNLLARAEQASICFTANHVGENKRLGDLVLGLQAERDKLLTRIEEFREYLLWLEKEHADLKRQQRRSGFDRLVDGLNNMRKKAGY